MNERKQDGWELGNLSPEFWCASDGWRSYALGVRIKCKPSLAASLLLHMDLDQFQQNVARLISYNFVKNIGQNV